MQPPSSERTPLLQTRSGPEEEEVVYLSIDESGGGGGDRPQLQQQLSVTVPVTFAWSNLTVR